MCDVRVGGSLIDLVLIILNLYSIMSMGSPQVYEFIILLELLIIRLYHCLLYIYVYCTILYYGDFSDSFFPVIIIAIIELALLLPLIL